LEKGAKIDATDPKGWNALMAAASNGRAETVKLLLKTGVDIEQKKAGDWNALLLAATRGQTDTVKLLLDRGAVINATESGGWTSLMLAAHDGHIKTVTLLLENGAEPDQKKPDGLTALMLAASKGQTETVQLLLEHGADINVKDNSGLTALNYATKTETVKALRAERLKLAVLLKEDKFEDETLTDELVDSKNKYLPGFIASSTAEQRVALLSDVEKRLVQAQRRILELNNAAEDAVRQGQNAASFRGQTGAIQGYMSVLKVIQKMLSQPQAGES
jgi:ankyrin repeat protein